MEKKNVIIKLNKGRIWFNESLSVDFSASNLPLKSMKMHPALSVYWLLEQSGFNKITGELEVKVVNYFLRDFEAFPSQNPKASINSIRFTDFADASSLALAIQYYSREMNKLDKALEEGYKEFRGTDPARYEAVSKKNPLFRTYEEKEKLEVNCEVWFKDSAFKLGYIVFDKDIRELKQMLHFKIANDFLLPEFELIKGYFIKALGTRKFDVQAVIFMQDGKPVETRASSSIIKKIDENLIDSIKFTRTNMLLRQPFKINLDKSLFTSEDIFDEMGDIEAGNVFNQREEEILRLILEKMNVRNRKQLEYLSGVKQAPDAKLKFTLHPYFGFLFTVEGEKMMHFIWELLNSHATYIWSLDKGAEDLRLQYKRVEDAINRVRDSGREQYKQAWRTSHVDQDLLFHVIHHEDAGSAFVEGFVKWRHRLGEVLV
jgi:hypothetical protein